MYPGPVSNVYLANSFLPSDFDGYLINTLNSMIIHTICRPGEYNLSSPVQVIQIDVSGHVELPNNSIVSLIFNISEVVYIL